MILIYGLNSSSSDLEIFTPNSIRNFVVDQNHNEQSVGNIPPTNHDIGNIFGSGKQNHDEQLSY
jgi:hypothetical protein